MRATSTSFTLFGLDYMAVKRNPSDKEKKLVKEHERTRLERSRRKIEKEFPPILPSD